MVSLLPVGLPNFKFSSYRSQVNVAWLLQFPLTYCVQSREDSYLKICGVYSNLSYLTTLFRLRRFYLVKEVYKIITNGEQVMIWKGSVVAFSRYSPGGLSKDTKIFRPFLSKWND